MQPQDEPRPALGANLIGFSRQALEGFCLGQGQPAFRAKQLLQWIHQRGVLDPQQMTDLPKGFRTKLARDFRIAPMQAAHRMVSKDGTSKRALRASGGALVESVRIPEPARVTLCVSSQAGCALGCAFCETGRQGFLQNLSGAEIISQLWLERFAPDREEKPVTNVVFMGMGEPLLNLDMVLQASSLMLDDCAYGISRRRVTLSTVGLVPMIRRLDPAQGLSLAISLHAPDDALRDELIPINRRYPIAQLLQACRDYLDSLRGKRHITVEYTLLGGINDSLEQAEKLWRLLAQLPHKVNLIPCNPIPGMPYGPPPDQRVDEFRRRLLELGARVTVRRPRGRDIQAACGQLAGELGQLGRRPARLGRRPSGREGAGGEALRVVQA